METVLPLGEGKEGEVVALMKGRVGKGVGNGNERFDGTAYPKVRLTESFSPDLVHHVKDEGVYPFDKCRVIEVSLS